MFSAELEEKRVEFVSERNVCMARLVLIPILICWSVLSASDRQERFGDHEVRINGVSAVGEIMTFTVPPSADEFDTIYSRWISQSDTFQKSLCKIPKQMDVNVLYNECCGGLYFEPQHPGAVFFKLTETDGKLYLGRYGGSGVILHTDSLIQIPKPYLVMFSAMETPYYGITIEVIDTSRSEDVCAGYDEVSDVEHGLAWFNGVRYIPQDHLFDYYIYRQCEIVYSCPYIWFDSSAVLVEYDAESKEGTISKYTPE